ncbi:MAG: GNAT family N-acetyltransferase, partial [Pseudomonadota bacterium]
MDFDNITIEICDDLPDRTVLDDMLADYYEPFVALMRGLGAPVSREELQSAQDEFWTNAADYMPPRGAVALARNELGQLIGLCNLKRLDAQSGELKRLYVKNEFRRKGLGSELLTALVSQASELGIARLIAEIL